jgi:hypothetical protein
MVRIPASYGKGMGRAMYLNSLLAHEVSRRMVTQTGIGTSVHVGLRPSLTKIGFLKKSSYSWPLYLCASGTIIQA